MAWLLSDSDVLASASVDRGVVISMAREWNSRGAHAIISRHAIVVHSIGARHDSILVRCDSTLTIRSITAMAANRIRLRVPGPVWILIGEEVGRRWSLSVGDQLHISQTNPHG